MMYALIITLCMVNNPSVCDENVTFAKDLPSLEKCQKMEKALVEFTFVKRATKEKYKYKSSKCEERK